MIGKLKNWALENRPMSLLASAGAGIFLSLAYLGLIFWSWDSCFLSALRKDIPQLFSGSALLVLALPTTFLLWVFRTHDVRRQIEEAERSNNFNNFSNAMRFFTEKDNLEANAIGLKLLAQLRQKGLYVNEIDLATRYKKLVEETKVVKGKFENFKYQGIDLQGADLRGIDLSYANLYRADLLGANLSGANLHRANLSGANLQGADLREASLREVNLNGVNLQNAIYNSETIFPRGFNLDEHRMINAGR